MQRQIERQFRNNILTPQSELIEINHIGNYLYERLKKKFNNTRRLSIKTFARKIQNLSIDTLKRKLQIALQNKRNNQCVRTPRKPLYHVPDYNVKGYEAIISLIKILARNRDGHGLGSNFTFDENLLRMPARRHDESKHLPCLSRSTCLRNNGTWNDGLCQPNHTRRGFPGIHSYTGQKMSRRTNKMQRGQYASSRNSNTKWRRPSRLNKL